jgi:hypothetical protein
VSLLGQQSPAILTSILTIHTPTWWAALESVPVRLSTASRGPSSCTAMTTTLSHYHLTTTLHVGGEHGCTTVALHHAVTAHCAPLPSSRCLYGTFESTILAFRCHVTICWQMWDFDEFAGMQHFPWCIQAEKVKENFHVATILFYVIQNKLPQQKFDIFWNSYVCSSFQNNSV